MQFFHLCYVYIFNYFKLKIRNNNLKNNNIPPSISCEWLLIVRALLFEISIIDFTLLICISTCKFLVLGDRVQKLCLSLSVSAAPSSTPAAMLLSSWIVHPLFPTLPVSRMFHTGCTFFLLKISGGQNVSYRFTPFFPILPVSKMFHTECTFSLLNIFGGQNGSYRMYILSSHHSLLVECFIQNVHSFFSTFPVGRMFHTGCTFSVLNISGRQNVSYRMYILCSQHFRWVEWFIQGVYYLFSTFPVGRIKLKKECFIQNENTLFSTLLFQQNVLYI